MLSVLLFFFSFASPINAEADKVVSPANQDSTAESEGAPLDANGEEKDEKEGQEEKTDDAEAPAVEEDKKAEPEPLQTVSGALELQLEGEAEEEEMERGGSAAGSSSAESQAESSQDKQVIESGTTHSDASASPIPTVQSAIPIESTSAIDATPDQATESKETQVSPEESREPSPKKPAAKKSIIFHY